MQGLVFGVGTDKGVIKLFDVRSYAQGPFDAFTVSTGDLVRCVEFLSMLNNATSSATCGQTKVHESLLSLADVTVLFSSHMSHCC